MSVYAQQLEVALQAELRATEACTDWLQQFVARIGASIEKRKPPFPSR
jgi:hypothetical protein